MQAATTHSLDSLISAFCSDCAYSRLLLTIEGYADDISYIEA